LDPESRPRAQAGPKYKGIMFYEPAWAQTGPRGKIGSVPLKTQKVHRKFGYFLDTNLIHTWKTRRGR